MEFEEYLQKNPQWIQSLEGSTNQGVTYTSKHIKVSIDGRKITTQELDKLILLMDESHDAKIELSVNYCNQG